MNRIRIPKKTETEVLFLSRHICCLCRDKNKDVQVHHIDEYNSNNEIENLAVLCLACHSKVTRTRGLGKQYSPLEVKRYKREWENVVKVQFGMATFRKTQNIPKIEKQLFVYEIKRLIHEMIGIQDSHKSLLSKNFEILLSISILEGFEREIIDQLQHAFSLTAIAEKNKPIILAHYLPRFFGHLVGPIKVPLEKKDEKNLLEAIETIEFSHNLSVEQNKSYAILKAFQESLSEFIQIAISYKNRTIFNKSKKVLKEIKETCNTLYHKEDKKIPKLVGEIDTLFKDIAKELKRAKLKWSI